MKSNDTVVILTPGFPAHQQEFECIPPLQDMLLAWLKRTDAPNIEIITFQYPFHAGTYQWHSIPVHAIGGKNRKLTRLLTWKKVRQKFAEIANRKNIRLIHSFWLTECAFVGAHLSEKFGIPHIATAMGQDVFPDNRFLKNLIIKKNKIAAISECCARQLERSTGRGADYIIPWGLGENWQNRNLTREREIDILGVGSLVPVKNFPLFLEIIRLIAERNPKLRVVIVGVGEEQKKLNHLAEKSGIASNLHFRGFLPRPEVLDLMEQSRVFLHTAAYEGQGIVFLEAQACGMKIVSTPVGMAQENENWALATSADELAAACEKFLDREPESTIWRVGSSFATMDNYLKVYQQLTTSE